MDIEKMIRKLARSVIYQNLYKSAKELNINIFENDKNLSGLQSLFLFWLSVYELLYSELNQREWRYLDEKVIENDIRTDAFLHWRSEIKKQEIDKHKREQKVDKLKFSSKGSSVSMFDIDFAQGDK
jgi:hypothetical protein